ncbi:MAG: YdcF family protein [Chthoniobacteraceae bacterium]
MRRYLIDQVIALLEPTGMTWAMLVALTIAFAWRRRYRAAIAVSVPMLTLFAFGSTDLPGALMRGLERPYAGVSIEAQPQADAIVVLGGGAQPARFEAADMHLNPAGDRIIMGLELARLGKAPVLVFGGSVAQFPEGPILESETVRDWVVERKLAPGEVIALPGCADTRDEAMFTLKIARERGWKQVLLVTSAGHMRRASATFRTAGLNVIPAPCNFITELSNAPTRGIAITVPRHSGLGKMANWLHEQIGWLEYRRRGWIDLAKL